MKFQAIVLASFLVMPYALADDHIITILNQGLNHIEEG